MKSKILSLILVFVMTLSCAVTVKAAEDTTYTVTFNDFTCNIGWQNNDQENFYYYLNQYTGPKDVENIIIPDNFDGHNIVGIGYELFKDMTSLKTVTLPDTITSIFGSAFEGCTSLTTINGLNDYTEYSIGQGAFSGTPWYEEKMANSPQKLITIGTTVYDMSLCSGDITVPEGITNISSCAFMNSDDLLVPNNNITSLYLPSTMENLNYISTLADCSNLESITVSEENPYFYSQDGILFSYATSELADNEKTLLIYPAQKKGNEYTVPADIKQIYCVRSQYLEKISFAGDEILAVAWAFKNCKNLSEINLPAKTVMYAQAFSGTKIKSIHIPEEFTTEKSSGGTAFTNCLTLENITLDSNNKEYELVDGALITTGTNRSLIAYPAARKEKTLTIPDGVKSVFGMEEALYLETIIVPKSVEIINVSTSTNEFKNIRNIKYKGTKEEWRKIFVGGMSGEITTEFNMTYNYGDLSGSVISGLKKSYVYTGKNIKPELTVKYDGKILDFNRDYTVSYNKNKLTGKATVTITGKGNYSGKKNISFLIVPKEVTKVKVKALSKQKANVSWKKDTTADGYHIQYSTSKSFKGAKSITVKSNKETKVTVSKMKKGKTYYIRVRAYKTIDGKKAYGAYSAEQKINIK